MKRPAKYLLIILVIVALISLSGCGSIANKITDAAKDKVEEQMNKDDEEDEDTDEETEDENSDETEAENDDENDDEDSTAITTSDSKSMDWPGDNMGNVPEIKEKITGVWSADGTCTLSYEGMERATAEDYIDSLKDLGYEDGFEGEEDDVLTFAKTDKDGNTVWFTYNVDGTGTILYTEASSS